MSSLCELNLSLLIFNFPSQISISSFPTYRESSIQLPRGGGLFNFEPSRGLYGEGCLLEWGLINKIK